MREKTKTKVAAFQAQLNKGASKAEAQRITGFSAAYFDKLQRKGDVGKGLKAAKARKAPRLITIPVQAQASQLVILMGSPYDVNAALDKLARIGVAQ